jgi:rhodanese-related sulfurtransferase
MKENKRCIMIRTMRIMDYIKRKDMLHRARLFFDDLLDYTRGPVELSRMIEEGQRMNIIDVRRAEDYAKGHLPGAVNLPEENWSTFKGLSKDRPNIVYCYSQVCQISIRAAKYFVEHEFPTILLTGGIEEWQKRNLPVEM